MRLLFSRVFGWQDGDHHGLTRFRITGIDNSSLSIAVAPATQGPVKGAVLLCHPFLKYGMSYFWRNRYHEWLNAAGYHVVSFDFKGFGTSKLSGISFADDVTSVATWTRERYPGLPLHLFGVSFGAYHGIHCLARHRERLAGAVFASAVFDSVPASIADFFSTGLSGAILRRISVSRWGRPTGTNSIFDSLAATGDLPCLFLYGRADKYISKSKIDRIAALCRNATVRIYENCGHLEICKQYAADYPRTVVGFIEEHPASAPWTASVGTP